MTDPHDVPGVTRDAGRSALARSLLEAAIALAEQQESHSKYEVIPHAWTQNDRLVMSVEEAGRALGVSRAHAYKLVASGLILSLRLGRRILVPRAALLKMLKD